jgi:DNA-binding FadR family transcriptional regulator
MARERKFQDELPELLNFLVSQKMSDNGRIPSLTNLSGKLDISVARLREQLEAARVLGVVEVRPKTGIRRLPYTFQPAVRQSLAYAIAVDPDFFQPYSDLRSHIEAAYWHQAVRLLTPEDLDYLWHLVDQAQAKLQGHPVQIPHSEHRELHLLIYRRLNNPFVIGLLEVYWEAYESIGLDVYTDLDYLDQVWQHHRRMVEAIRSQDFDGGYDILIRHMNLLYQRTKPVQVHKFE